MKLKKLLLTILLFLQVVYGVTLNKDINATKTDSRKNDDVQFGLEFGAKTDFWNPGLSKEQGGKELLKYDTEGLYLGYTKFKTKIYGTDVLTLEKFGTLKSSDNQNKLLEKYKDDRKRDSSFQGYKASIQIMKIFNYLFDTKVLDGLGYEYTSTPPTN